MRGAVLALQGDFAEHEAAFAGIVPDMLQIRQKSDLQKGFDFIVLPGGESTVQGKLLRELDMLTALQDMITGGLPVMATCAGTILLAKQLLDDSVVHLGTLGIAVRRNAYGRQISSFFAAGDFAGMKDVPMSFIRAPRIEFCTPDVTALAEYNGRITAVRCGNQLAMTFHPELSDDRRIVKYFLDEIVRK